eukprot:5520823-Karenia_brevis.AAC.1
MEAVRALRSEIKDKKFASWQTGVPASSGEGGSQVSGDMSDRRRRQMTVRGFEFNTAKKAIEEKLAEIERDLEVKCKDKFAPGPLASKGILEFRNA